MLRFRNLKELRKAISPDVEIIDVDEPSEVKKEVVRQSSNSKVLEDQFLSNWTHLGGPPLEREVRFHPTRRWRLDFALPAHKIGIEIHGGLYQAESGHRSMAGVKRDMEKATAAQEEGWIIYYLTSQHVKDARYLEGLIGNVRFYMEGGRVK